MPDIIKTKGDLAFTSTNQILEDEGFTSKQTQKSRGEEIDKKDLITKDLFNPIQPGVLRGWIYPPPPFLYFFQKLKMILCLAGGCFDDIINPTKLL